MEHKEKIHVANLAQKVLLDHELTGQISDGHWENSRPQEHYRSWCRAEVTVNPTNTGINFYAMRVYDFLSEELLKVVRTRMILYVRLAQKLDNKKDIELAEHFFTTISNDQYCRAFDSPEFEAKVPQWMANDTSPDYRDMVARMEAMLSDADLRNYFERTCTLPIKTRAFGVYNLIQLRRDLTELKAIQHRHIKE